MALSGSLDFGITKLELIDAALQHIGALGDGESASATQITECSRMLNMLIKNWQVDGMQLWMRYYGYILPMTGVTHISLGAEGGHAATSYQYTTTSTTSSSGTNTITVSSVTGISSGDNIGIELSDGTMQWTTVNGAPVGSVVTLASNLSGDVASGADVYAYASANKLTRPAEIVEAFRRHSSDMVDTNLRPISMQEYNMLGDKTTKGTPVQWTYDPILNYSTSGYPGNADFYFWPCFENGDDLIVIKYIKLFDDLDANSDNPEFPQQWFMPLMMGLAWFLAPKHGIPLKERQMLLQEAELYRKRTLDADQEPGSVLVQPDYQMRR